MSTVNVSISPHIRSNTTTRSIMLDVIIAVIPSVVFGVVYFGWQALVVVLVSVLSCVLTEFIYEKLMKLPVTIGDLSAVVTGLILSLTLYSTTPWWVALIGGVFAILIVKMLFGGLGQNFMNPALAARCFLLLSFSKIMTTYPVIDGVSSATPLALYKAAQPIPVSDLFLGLHSGTIGETSIIAILIGALYLIVKRVIPIKIPLSVILSSAGFISLFTLIKGEPLTLELLIVHIFGGGLLLGAVFMATDYTTTPVTPWGQVIFGVLVGLFTAVIRLFGNATEGISFAIILCNLLTPLIEKATYPRVHGIKKARRGK